MSEPAHIRFAGYSPPNSTQSRALVRFREEFLARCGNNARVDIYWNVFDFGYKGLDLIDMVESGRLTMCYSSTAYGLSDIIPELQVIDLPYLFKNHAHAHRMLDGELGAYLTKAIERKKSFRVLGYWDNGFRHISNRLRPIRNPGDLSGLRIRLMPNEIHKKTFELLGAIPVSTNLEQGLAMMASGDLDAQENPLANLVNYGIQKYHRYITMSGHFYAARGIFVHKNTFDSWPEEIQIAVRESMREAVLFQRDIAQQEELKKRAELEKGDAQFVDLTDEERSRFLKVTSLITQNLRSKLPAEIFSLVDESVSHSTS